MSSSVEAFFAAVQTRYMAADPSAAIKWGYGPKAYADQKNPRRVVLMMGDPSYETVDRAGPRPGVAGGPEHLVIYYRRVPLLWHVWMPDEEQLEQVTTNLVIIQRAQLASGGRTVFTPQGEKWLNHADPALTYSGAYGILSCSVVWRLDNHVSALTQSPPITDQQHTGSFAGEDVC